MSVTKNIFERIEKKYYLKEDQYNRLIKEIRNRLSPDEYGKSTINSLYFDTEDYRMMRKYIKKSFVCAATEFPMKTVLFFLKSRKNIKVLFINDEFL